MGCLAFVFASAPFFADSMHGMLLEMAGLFLGVLAILHMGIGNFNIRPIPKPGGELVTTGVYQWIRHPMYLAQVLVLLALVIDYPSHYRAATLLILCVNLFFKLRFEEKQLKEQFPGYEAYCRNSWRILPYLY